MPTAVISATVSGTLDTADRRAMLFVLNQENARRAALTPPEPALPISTNVEIRTSYATVQSALLNSAHLSYVTQSDVASLQDIRSAWERATDQQRNAALNALTT